MTDIISSVPVTDPRQALVTAALDWERRFACAPSITSAIAEYDAAHLVGHDDASYASGLRGPFVNVDYDAGGNTFAVISGTNKIISVYEVAGHEHHHNVPGSSHQHTVPAEALTSRPGSTRPGWRWAATYT